MPTPTLINLPPPPSDPATPSEMGPGTPNSATTSLSALSTVAIKDGHQGHTFPHGHHTHHSRDSASSTTTLDAERADRISRLAGLERVSAGRAAPQSHLGPGAGPQTHPPGYFDSLQAQGRERSTVGSASATGSVGGHTTWAEGSMDYDADKMSEDQDDGVSSTGGFSDEGNASLVGFGEGASSTVSGPISTATARAMTARQTSLTSPSTSKASAVPPHMQYQTGSPMSGVVPSGALGSTDPRMMDGMSYDTNIIDTTMQPASAVGQPAPYQTRGHNGGSTDTAERAVRDRLHEIDAGRRYMEISDE